MLQKNVLIIEEKEEMFSIIQKVFENETEYNIIFSLDNKKSIKEGMLNFPDIIIVNTNNYTKTYNEIKNNGDILMTPIIIFLEEPSSKNIIEHMKMGVNLCISKDVESDILLYNIKNYISLVNNNRTISPLTGLPGNIQISNEIKKRLIKKLDFSVLYCDLNNFKAYNDTYGFLKGDDVIKLTADVIWNVVKKLGNKDDFLGHIGGDDFIAITSSENIDKICNGIINKFDDEIMDLFNQADIERGFFEVPNRRGILEQYPLTSIAIGVVKVDKNDKVSELEIGEIGAQVKHKAKTIPGSAYVINNRKIYKEE